MGLGSSELFSTFMESLSTALGLYRKRMHSADRNAECHKPKSKRDQLSLTHNHKQAVFIKRQTAVLARNEGSPEESNNKNSIEKYWPELMSGPQ